MKEFFQTILVIAVCALVLTALMGVIALIDLLGWSEWITQWAPVGVAALVWWLVAKAIRFEKEGQAKRRERQHHR